MKYGMLLIVLLVPSLLTAQLLKPFKNCKRSWKEVSRTWNTPAVIDAARDYMSHCASEVSSAQRVELYRQMGRTLVAEQRYSEADPILRDCRSIAIAIDDYSDLSACWIESGKGAAYRGWCSLARMAFRNTEQIAPIDNTIAAAHGLAALWIERLDRASATGGELILPASYNPHSQEISVQCTDEEPVGVIQ